MLDEPALRGWLVPAPVFGLPDKGTKGLKVDDARDFVAAVSSPPPTDRLCAYLACLEGSADRVQDVLLKALEDHDTSRVTILLATSDIGTVMPTVRSRCHERWCGGEIAVPALLGVAQGLVADLKAGRFAEFLDPFRKKAHDPTELLQALTVAVRNDPALWVKLRPLHGYPNLNLADILGALI